MATQEITTSITEDIAADAMTIETYHILHKTMVGQKMTESNQNPVVTRTGIEGAAEGVEDIGMERKIFRPVLTNR